MSHGVVEPSHHVAVHCMQEMLKGRIYDISHLADLSITATAVA